MIHCKVCNITPEQIAKGNRFFNYATAQGEPLCSMECRAENK